MKKKVYYKLNRYGVLCTQLRKIAKKQTRRYRSSHKDFTTK